MAPQRTQRILALDIGTSSTRASLYDVETGDALAGSVVSHPHEPATTPDGGATLDADALVHEAIACASEAMSRAHGVPVVAVAVSTFWHSFVGVDRDHRARTPLLLWSDRRSAAQVARLRDEMDAGAYTQRTGCPLHTSYLPGRLRWLAETDGDAFAACARFLSPGEYLFARLFGGARVTCSVSMASATGLMHQIREAWDDETLAHLPGMSRERLSPLGDDSVSGIRDDAARGALGTLGDVPWFPALGDGACSNLGCGATGPDRLALMIGTSGALRVVVGGAAPHVPPGLWRYQADAKRYLLGGALSNGGSVWAWLMQTLRLPERDNAAEDAVAALAPDAHGLTVLPFYHGERAPGWHDDARAVVIGLRASNTAPEIARAHLEAVAYRFAAIRDRLRGVAPGGESIGTGAGLLASPVWAQILADVLGEPIQVSSEEQASSRGAALHARERLGFGRIEDAPTTIVARCEPDPAKTEIYAQARARHEALYRQMLPPT